jgi:hypothetical protein
MGDAEAPRRPSDNGRNRSSRSREARVTSSRHPSILEDAMHQTDPRPTLSSAGRQPASPASRLHLLLLVEGASFVAASMVHRGAFVSGYEHGKAAVAETVIGSLLLAGFLAAWTAPRWRRTAAIGVQAFALLGTLVGLFTIAIGVGPRTGPDLAYHAAILALLGYGLATVARAPRERGPRRAGGPRGRQAS